MEEKGVEEIARSNMTILSGSDLVPMGNSAGASACFKG